MSAQESGLIQSILESSLERDAEIADLRAKLAKAEQWGEELCSVLQRRGDEIIDLRAKLAEAEKLLDEIYIALDGLPISSDMASAKSRAYLDAPQQIADLRAKLAEAEQLGAEWKARYHAVKECQEAWVKRAREAEAALHAWQKAFGTTFKADYDAEIARLKAEKGEG